MDPDLGDTWAWYYKFLMQHGTDVSLRIYSPQRKSLILNKEKRADVEAKCILSEPRHGEIWQSVAKDPKNASKKTVEILKTVVTRLE